MSLWFRDVISEGKVKFYLLHFLQSIHYANNDLIKTELTYDNKDPFGYYLAGLLEGDGHISLPYKGSTVLNRILNPRIVFTGHINDIELYKFVQYKLNGIGRFQFTNNVLRYIIGDVKGIYLFINVVHNKIRTPKNEVFNDLITFMNKKYLTSIPESNLDCSDFKLNGWFSGFTEADGHFGVKIT